MKLIVPLSGMSDIDIDYFNNNNIIMYFRSKDFRHSYGRLYELRALVPHGTPIISLTATVTPQIRCDILKILDIDGCKEISVSPNRPNIYYEVMQRTCSGTVESDIEHDLGFLIKSLEMYKDLAPRVLVYCRKIDMCSNLFDFFLLTLGEHSYLMPNSEISSNRLFAMYHSNTPAANKTTILDSLLTQGGIIRIVFATNALGMGVNISGLNRVIHYGAPTTLEGYFQESGRAGRTGDQSTSTVYWTARDCPLYTDPKTTLERDSIAVRSYLDNKMMCRRRLLLQHFDTDFAQALPKHNPILCCDYCRQNINVDVP